MTAVIVTAWAITMNAQTGLKKVYNEDIDPMEQIDGALVKAKATGKFVVCRGAATVPAAACRFQNIHCIGSPAAFHMLGYFNIITQPQQQFGKGQT